MHGERERETNWLLWISWIFLFGWNKTVSELIFTAAKMCQLAGISKDTKIHNFLITEGVCGHLGSLMALVRWGCQASLLCPNGRSPHHPLPFRAMATGPGLWNGTINGTWDGDELGYKCRFNENFKYTCYCLCPTAWCACSRCV